MFRATFGSYAESTKQKKTHMPDAACRRFRESGPDNDVEKVESRDRNTADKTLPIFRRLRMSSSSGDERNCGDNG